VPAASPSAATPAPPETPAAAPATAPSTTGAAATTAGAGQYQTEAEARGHCPSDTIVWANLKSKVYHFAGTKTYGTTRRGAYMCEKQALTQGDRASKTEKHP
jgi:hypothetical protein